MKASTAANAVNLKVNMNASLTGIDYATNDDRIHKYTDNLSKLHSIDEKCSIMSHNSIYFVKQVAHHNSINNISITEENLSIILSKFVLNYISPHFYLYYDTVSCKVNHNGKVQFMTYILYEQCRQTFNTYFGFYSVNPFSFFDRFAYEKIEKKQNDYNSFLVQMKMADITLNAYGITIGDRQGKNFMYISIDPECYLYYLLDNKHIYVKSYGKLWVHIDYERDGTRISQNTTKPTFDMSLFNSFKKNIQLYIITETPRDDIILFNKNPFRLFDETINSNTLYTQYFAKKSHKVSLPELESSPILRKTNIVLPPMPTSFSFANSHLPPIKLRESDNVYKYTELTPDYLTKNFREQTVGNLMSIIQQLWEKAGSIVISTPIRNMKSDWDYKHVKTIIGNKDYPFGFFVVKEQDTYYVIYSESYGVSPALNNFKKILTTLKIGGRYKRKTRKHKKVKRYHRTYRL
jgi:hypothetical protein